MGTRDKAVKQTKGQITENYILDRNLSPWCVIVNLDSVVPDGELDLVPTADLFAKVDRFEPKPFFQTFQINS